MEGRMRILVVEDDLEAQRYLVNGLKEAGHVVDDAADGETGLTLALSRPYDSPSSTACCPSSTACIWWRRCASIATPCRCCSSPRSVRSRRPGQGIESGRRRLSDQALCLRGIAGAHRRLDAPALARFGQDQAVGRRSGTRPSDPHRHARQPGDRSSAARVPPARISDAPCGPGRHPHHAA